jgi:phospholipid/cholesterol/gamma-HCH transport system ATP-binding protein
MVTHDVDTLCALADRVAVLAEQKIVALGSLPEVSATGHPFVHDFFLGHRDRCATEGLAQYRETLSHEALETTA